VKKRVLQNGWVCDQTGAFGRKSIVIANDRIEALVDAEHPQDDRDGTEVVDLGGGYVLPGFVDTHIHLTSIALKSFRCDLSAVRSIEALLETLAQWASSSDAPHVMGVDWDETRWERPVFPTRRMLDELDSTRPVLVRRVCGHIGVANSPLLRRLSKHTGLIDEGTGVICEDALWLAGRMFDPTGEALVPRFGPAIEGLHRMGITAIHDIVGEGMFETYLDGIRSSQAPLRIDALLHTNPENFKRFEALCDGMGGGFRLSGVKCFLDGSIGGRTAALNAPYNDGDESGMLLLEDNELAAILRTCYDGGFVCAMHTIGDRAIDQALRTVEPFPPDTACIRLEHCEVVGPDQLRRLREAPVFLSLQPNFIRSWGQPGGLYEQRLGKERLRWCNPFRALLESSIDFVMGSDGMPPGPLFGIKGATEHPVAEQRIEMAEVIARYTTHPNRLRCHRREAGVIEGGRLADLVVLTGNPFETDTDEIDVAMTFVGGAPVYTA
jgi:predicted amidohydrolase YtcJ